MNDRSQRLDELALVVKQAGEAFGDGWSLGPAVCDG